MRPGLRLVGLLGVGAAAGCGGTAATDAGPGAPDAGSTRDVARIEAGGSDASGPRCAFSDDCDATDYCDCPAPGSCACVAGARGTGRVGVDPCVTGRDCVSGLCAEVAPGSFYCTGPCREPGACAGMLPVCGTIPGVGQGCIPAAR